MTIYVKALLDQIESQHDRLTARQLLEKMVELGIVDRTLCKVLAVRQEVERLIQSGKNKTDAMWFASEKFCYSYEYVRKCMYYYTDINV